MGNTRLDSWKEIARYLGRDVRTVIRWEQQRGLPVYRVPGGKLSRVFAYPEELDAWLARGSAAVDELREANGQENGETFEEPLDNGSVTADAPGHGPPHRHRPRGLLLGVGVAVAAGAVTLAGWAFIGEGEPPVRFAIAGNDLLALDASGRTQWTYRPTSGDMTPPPARWTHIGDLDADGRTEAVVALETTRPPSNQHGGELLRFSSDGRLQWSTSLTDRIQFRDGEYGPPWPVADLTVYRSGNERRIAWTAHHFTWWPGLMTTFDGQGRRLGTFVNSGWIRGVTPSTDGRHLIVTGVSNSRDAYFFAVLDANDPSGRSPEPPGSPLECLSCPTGDPVRYVVLPRTDISRTQVFPGDGPSVTTLEDGGMLINVLESGGPKIAATVYELSADLVLRSARFSSSFWEWHRQLEQDGTLDHRAEDCPERSGLNVESWTPAAGWETVLISAR